MSHEGRLLCPFTLYEVLPLNLPDRHQMSVSGEVERPRVITYTPLPQEQPDGGDDSIGYYPTSQHAITHPPGEACPHHASCKRCRPDDSRGTSGHGCQQGATKRCRGTDHQLQQRFERVQPLQRVLEEDAQEGEDGNAQGRPEVSAVGGRKRLAH